MPTSQITTVIDNRKKLQEKIEALARRSVLVGIPEKEDARPPPSKIGNAALGYLFEFGSPATNMPARAWLVPGVVQSQRQWQGHLRRALQLALSLDGKEVEIDQALTRAGQVAVNAIKKRIRNKLPPPLAVSTILARRRKHPGRKAGKPLPGESKTAAALRTRGHQEMRDGVAVLVGSAYTPLIDDGHFVGAISFVIEKGPGP